MKQYRIDCTDENGTRTQCAGVIDPRHTNHAGWLSRSLSLEHAAYNIEFQVCPGFGTPDFQPQFQDCTITVREVPLN